MPIRFLQDNRTQRFSDCNFFSESFQRGNCRSSSCLTPDEAAYLAALCRLQFAVCIPWRRLETLNQDKNKWYEKEKRQQKTKIILNIYLKNQLLLRISAVIGRYGPHSFNDTDDINLWLRIAFETVQEFPTRVSPWPDSFTEWKSSSDRLSPWISEKKFTVIQGGKSVNQRQIRFSSLQAPALAGSRPITEVNVSRARLVLGWVTAWEHRVLLASFFFFFFFFPSDIYFF